jgi:hypothetical protein
MSDNMHGSHVVKMIVRIKMHVVCVGIEFNMLSN